jgi:RNA polymerase sigma-70 factor (ECF subfamily)
MDVQTATLAPDELQRELVPRLEELRTAVERKIPDRLRPLVSVDDVLQEVWMAAFKNLSTFTPRGPAAVERWLRTIVTSKLVDAIRAARGPKRGGDRCQIDNAQHDITSLTALFEHVMPAHKTPSSEYGKVENAHAVSIALARLSDRRRRAVHMRYVEGRSRSDIARTMDMTEAAVNSLIYHGLRDLRRFLGDAAKYFSDARSADIAAHAGSSDR